MNKRKKEMIEKIQDALLKEIEFVRYSKDKDLDTKVDEVDVLFDTIKFLKDYEENIRVLNKHYTENRWKDK